MASISAPHQPHNLSFQLCLFPSLPLPTLFPLVILVAYSLRGVPLKLPVSAYGLQYPPRISPITFPSNSTFSPPCRYPPFSLWLSWFTLNRFDSYNSFRWCFRRRSGRYGWFHFFFLPIRPFCHSLRRTNALKTCYKRYHLALRSQIAPQRRATRLTSP